MVPTINKPSFIKIGITIYSIFLLIYAIISKQSYGFYIFLRIFIFFSSLYLAYLAYEYKEKQWLIRFIIIVFVYNPIIRLPLGKDFWEFINLITLLLFVSSLFKFKIKQDEIN